jgi:glycosyltransferase
MPPHPTFFVKKEVYQNFGLYNTELRSAADYEYMLRVIHKHGISLTYMPRILTKMRVGGMSNVSLKNRWRANMEDRRAWKMNGVKPRWYTLTVKPLSKLLQFLNK